MSYATSKPPGSPWCWGQVTKYQDNDPECIQCPFKESCRASVMVQASQQPQRPSLPAALPPRLPMPTYGSPIPQLPIIRPQAPAPPVPTTYAYQPQYQAPATTQQPYQYLDSNNPHPSAPMYRAGTQHPPYYPSMHPGETMKERMVKNVLLRILEAMFIEIGNFFRHWTWPPKN